MLILDVITLNATMTFSLMFFFYLCHFLFKLIDLQTCLDIIVTDLLVPNR